MQFLMPDGALKIGSTGVYQCLCTRYRKEHSMNIFDLWLKLFIINREKS